MRIVELPEIEKALRGLDVLPLIEAGFVAYSEGRAVVPPVGELILDEGETHIKYGFIRGEPWYVIKIASGFYKNPERGLPSGDGMMLLFTQSTGQPVATLLDHGRLTDVRTAAAGAIGARYLSPSRVERIGVAGTGVQARLQVEHLKPVIECRSVLAWGRSDEKLDSYRRDMEAEGLRGGGDQGPGGARHLLPHRHHDPGHRAPAPGPGRPSRNPHQRHRLGRAPQAGARSRDPLPGQPRGR